MMSLPRTLLMLATLIGVVTFPMDARAVLLSAGDGTGNTSAPPNDPGWANVGTRESLSAVYLGNRWVLTANHAGFGDATFGGVTYTAVTGSKVRLENPDDSNADLQMFKIVELPPLPDLAISSSPPPSSSELTLIGNGRNRGDATTFMGAPGWEWGPGHTLRWGTAAVDRFETVLGTEAIVTVFQQAGTADEAQGVVGDSGGAAFYESVGGWELAGILYARGEFGGQPGETSFFGNETYVADLSVYRAQIVANTTLPGCSDGLDDDEDSLTDYPEDPGCSSPADLSEWFACEDGLDNDGDGFTDFPADVGCAAASDPTETPTPSVPSLSAGATAGAVALLAVAGAFSLARSARPTPRRDRGRCRRGLRPGP